MPGKTYNNQITVDEVSLGITGLLIAPKDTAWTTGRVDISSPPASFYSVGAVVEDTPTFTMTREKFQLKTGIPKVTQYEQIMAIDGKFKVTCESKDWSKVEYMLGNTAPDTTAWATTPTSSTYVVQHYGTRQLKEYVLLAVTDFIDGTQLVQHFYRAKAADEVTEEYRPNKEGQIPLSYDLLAKVTSLSSGPELVIGKRVQFGPDGTGV